MAQGIDVHTQRKWNLEDAIYKLVKAYCEAEKVTPDAVTIKVATFSNGEPDINVRLTR